MESTELTTEQMSYRERVLALEAIGLSSPPVEIELHHHFTNGVYAREMRVPAGIAMTGKVHLFESINILVKGTVRVLTDKGHEDLSAPMTFVSPPGTKRGGVMLTDCIWITICRTDALTPEDAERELVVDSYEAYEIKQLEASKCLLA